ncbi:MAG: hypothetical protein ACM3X4_05465 [Ignavibacteriales bacterium]
MRHVKFIVRQMAITVLATTAGLPVTLTALGVMVFARWRIVPFRVIVVNLAQSAVWYWFMLLAPAASGVALPVTPAWGGVTGALLAVAASVPCVAAMTGSSVAGVMSAFASRRVDSAIIILAAASGGSVAGAVGALLRSRKRRRE